MLETPFPFLICKTPGEFPIFETFSAKKKMIFCQFWSLFTKKPLFESVHVWKRHCDVIRWPIFMILVSMERGDTTLYYSAKQSYFGTVIFKFIRGVVTTPLVNHVTKKGLVGRGLNKFVCFEYKLRWCVNWHLRGAYVMHFYKTGNKSQRLILRYGQ